MISSQVVRVVKYVMPHGLVQQIVRAQALRRRRVAAHNIAQVRVSAQSVPYKYTAAIEFLCARGLPRGHVVEGSMPESALAFCSKTLDNLIPTIVERPLVGLHVGNFLGVSLVHFVNYARKRNQKSVVVSIDPNVNHRGIDEPQKHVIAVLNHFALQENAIICVGYSEKKTLSNDGIAFIDQSGVEYDPYSGFETSSRARARY